MNPTCTQTGTNYIMEQCTTTPDLNPEPSWITIVFYDTESCANASAVNASATNGSGSTGGVVATGRTLLEDNVVARVARREGPSIREVVVSAFVGDT